MREKVAAGRMRGSRLRTIIIPVVPLRTPLTLTLSLREREMFQNTAGKQYLNDS